MECPKLGLNEATMTLGGTTVEECKQYGLLFTSVSGKKVEADFEGGVVTSDSGVLLVREIDRKLGVIDSLASALRDKRHPSYIEHSLEDLLRQRVFQLVCGYEDGNDSDDLRSDPALKLGCDRLPLTGEDLASQPTMSRLENSPSRTDLYRLALAFGELFIKSYKKPPKEIILDLDDTDDVVHGSQQLRLFNAYVGDYCYMPLHIHRRTVRKVDHDDFEARQKAQRGGDGRHSQAGPPVHSESMAEDAHPCSGRLSFQYSGSPRSVRRQSESEIPSGTGG